MDIKSKKYNTYVQDEYPTPINGKKAKIKRFFTSGAIRVFAFLLACIMGMCTLVWIFQLDQTDNNVNLFTKDNYISSSEYISSKNNLYQALCITASIYMRNCNGSVSISKDGNLFGKFSGSKYLYKSYINSLRHYAYDNFIEIDSSGGTPRIESNFYDYYVSFGNNVMTNISSLKGVAADSSTVQSFKNESQYWYARFNNEISYDEKHYSENYQPYYIYNDYSGYSSDALYPENEEYPSFSVPLGWSGKDNYDRYIMCYGPFNDLILYDFDTSDSSKQYIVNGYQTVKISSDYNSYEDTYEKGGYIYTDRPIEGLDNYEFTSFDDSDITVLIRPKQDKLAVAQAKFSETADYTNRLTVRLTIAVLVLTVCLIYLIAVCGYKESAGGKNWHYAVAFGRWHTEFLIIGIIAAASFAVLISAGYDQLDGIISSVIDLNKPYTYWVTAGAAAIMLAVCLGLFLGLVSKIKVHTFWKDFYIIKLLKSFIAWFSQKLKSSGLYANYDKQSISRKLFIREWIFIGATATQVLIIITGYGAQHYVYDNGYEFYQYGINSNLAVISIIAYIAYFIWFIITEFRIYRDINRLSEQIDQMSNGIEPESDITNTSLIYSDSTKLSEIFQNIKETVEKQVQSERMKIELVTNVSHDLKTPLTSIISYIDLLKSEDLSPEAMDYVKILEQKSEKLKNIVADVFSLAKATSGVDIDSEQLDSVILLNQALADAQDKIEKSGRQLKVDIKPKSAMIIADGTKLYRVFQNLIDNALNYSMDGTRIFLTMTEENGYVHIEMKNIASYEMNFTPEEITERFTRGDKSRTDGGNGLGLSIAKTFTEACGGAFRIELDGDVFKAVINFQTVKNQNDIPLPVEQEKETQNTV